MVVIQKGLDRDLYPVALEREHPGTAEDMFTATVSNDTTGYHPNWWGLGLTALVAIALISVAVYLIRRRQRFQPTR